MKQTLAHRRLLCAHMYITVALLVTAFAPLGFNSIIARTACAIVNAVCAVVAVSLVLERDELLLCFGHRPQPRRLSRSPTVVAELLREVELV